MPVMGQIYSWTLLLVIDVVTLCMKSLSVSQKARASATECGKGSGAANVTAYLLPIAHLNLLAEWSIANCG
jgi:hypothetical protein